MYRIETQRAYEIKSFWKRERGGTGLGNFFVDVVYWTNNRVKRRASQTRSLSGTYRLTSDEAKSFWRTERGGTGNLFYFRRLRTSDRIETGVVQDSHYSFTNNVDWKYETRTSAERYQGAKNLGTYESWHWEEFRKYIQFHTHRIDADRPIVIQFIGHDQGIVNVNSPNSDVILYGTLTNTGGTTSINAQRIRARSPQVTIQSNNVTLTAQNGISDVAIEASSASANGAVTATTATGNLNLEYNAGTVNYANLQAQNGDITFKAYGNVNYGSFRGNSINLTSTLGSITGVVDTGDANDHTLTVTTKGDINLRETEGHLRVSQVQSTEGDVTLQVERGDLLDGHVSNVEQESVLDELEKFVSSDAVDAHIDAIEAAKQAEFNQYWQARNHWEALNAQNAFGRTGYKVVGLVGSKEGIKSNTYRFTYNHAQQKQLRADGKTDAEILTLETIQTEWVKARHKEFGSPEFYDPNYTYEFSQTQEQQLKDNLSATVNTIKEQLDLLGNAQTFEYFFSLLNEDVGIGRERANVIGHDITLIAKRGSIGEQVGNDLIIDRTQLLNVLSDDQEAALTSAETQGIIQRQGNIVAIASKEDFDIRATGIVNASANDTTSAGNIYVGSTATIAIGEIRAGGEVQVRSSGTVTDGNGDANNVTHGSSLLVLPQDTENILETDQSQGAVQFRQ